MGQRRMKELSCLVMLLHHTLSISGMSVSIYYGMYGTEMMATLLGTELTNPLLQLRWFLKECGRGDGLLADVVDHLFVILFGFIRLIIGSMLLYSYFHQPTDYLGRFAGVCIYSIGWLFWISVMQFAIKKYKKKLKRWRKAKGGTSNEKLLDDSDSERDLVKTNDELPESEISVSDKTENPTVLKSRSKMENSNSVSNGCVLNSSKCDSACVNGAEIRSPVNCISADSGRLKTD